MLGEYSTKYAHTAKDKPVSEWHELDDHLAEVAKMARAFAEAFGAGDWGECAGLLHDVGKATQKFQKYLRLCAEGKGRRGSAPHAVHGGRLVADKHKGFGKLLAYMICGHHGGLPDWNDLERRLVEVQCLDEAAAIADFGTFPKSLPFRECKGNRQGFVFSFFTRMLFSCLVDADWLDTEKFMDPKRAAWRTAYPDIPALAKRFFPHLEKLNDSADPTPVNLVRREVLEACRAAAELPPGLFSLTVPTGGGKTLSSLEFALRHAEKHGLKRIVYVIPYMSIIEQNADVFREFLGHEAVVEHHSSFDPDTKKNGEEDEDHANRRAKLACENWDAPIIATTAVQFFESLFASKPSRCRKLHNLARSVIILDEAQMLPRPLLLPCLAAIRELALRYGASVVLCTATQPAVSKRDDFVQGLEGVREIIPATFDLHARLQRVRVEWLGGLDDESLATRLRSHTQTLCIVNTRGHARKLYERLAGCEGLMHLSANMTPTHRSCKIAEIKAALKEKRPCLVVSTQLVEAGVDIDFPVVFRAAAGLDSIAQAAGRCDREGRLTAAAGIPAGQVYVFLPTECKLRGDFAVTADKAEEIHGLGDYPDLLAPEAIEHYFRLLFWQAGDDLDAKGILKNLEEGVRVGNFPFRSVDRDFSFIAKDMLPVIVPHEDEAAALVCALKYAPALGDILRKLQRYTVQLHPKAWNELLAAGASRLALEGVAVLENLDIYSRELGLSLENPAFRRVEGLIF